MRSLPKCVVFSALVVLIVLPACGGGGGGASGDSVATLSGVPTIDLSNYDYSTSGASAMVAAKTKGLGDNVGAEGRFSRAGCEASSHKQHIIMESKMVQLSRCYPEAMDAAGLITIPTGSYGYYRILVPESLMVGDPNDQPEEEAPEVPDQCVAVCPGEPVPQECIDCVEQHCQANPDDPVCDALQQYLAQAVRQQNDVAEIILMRLGRFENGTALHVDMCKESQVDSSVRRTEESTYTATAGSIVANIIHKDEFQGESFNMAFDITFTGASVDADGIATLGAGGSAVADGRFIDPYGEGHIHFEALADTRSNVLYGTFSGNFEDEFLGGTQQFTDKMYAQFGGADRTGTGKWFYSGTFPAFPVSLMVPEGIPDAELADFLNFMSQELGVPLSENEGDQYYYGDVFTCPPANCTPESPPEDCAPVMDDDGICVENGRTGVESFRIAGTPPNQTFTIIPDALSAFFEVVDAYDIAALSADVGTIDYARSWDCTPANEWTVIDPSEHFSAQVAAEREVNATVLQNRIEGCMQLEEQARAGGGMGEYRCHQEEMGDDIEGEGMNDEGEFDFNPWEPVACDPQAQGDGGPLDDIWDDDIQGIQASFGTFAELQDACEICRDTVGAGEGAVDEQKCEAVLDAFKHLGPR